MIINPGTLRRRKSIKSLLTRTKMIFTSNSYNGGIWLPKDVATLFQDSAGTTPVTATTNPVGKVSDQSGNSNHLLQGTSAARPTWEVDANGKYCLRLLGTDDHYTCATGGGGSAGGYWCFALKPTGGAGTTRYIFDDRGVNTGYRVNLNTSNQLVLAAGNGAAYTAKASTASINVGTLHRLTCLDDGINLSVKINNAAAEITARPVVVAGSAGFTMGKSNLAASEYQIADFYAGIYVRNACPSAADRAVFESLVDACTGL